MNIHQKPTNNTINTTTINEADNFFETNLKDDCLKKDKKTGEKKFYFQGTMIFLTYKEHIPKENYIQWFHDHIDDKTKFIRIAHETGDKLVPYNHSHILIQFKSRKQITSQKKLDYYHKNLNISEPLHPNIRKVHTLTHFSNIKRYLAKEDTDNKDLLQDEDTLWTKIEQCSTLREVCDKHLEKPNDITGLNTLFNLSRNIKSITYIADENKHPWQLSFEELIKISNKRDIHWVTDTIGNTGKTQWSLHMEDQYDNEWIGLDITGRQNDFGNLIINKINNGWKGKGLILDLPRSYEDRNSIYTCLESCKNGRITSTKYQGGTSRFDSNIQIWIFSNFYPNVHMMSKDRWKIYKINEKKELIHLTLAEAINLHQKENAVNITSLEKELIQAGFNLSIEDLIKFQKMKIESEYDNDSKALLSLWQ